MFEIMALVLLSQQPSVPVTEGVASFYTTKESTSLTASGERLRDDIYSCAMLEGTFGDYYLVVADNRRSVVCKLNDRGPTSPDGSLTCPRRRCASRTLKGLVHVKVYCWGRTRPRRGAPARRWAASIRRGRALKTGRTGSFPPRLTPSPAFSYNGSGGGGAPSHGDRNEIVPS